MDEKGFIWLGDYAAGRLSKREARELRRWLDEEEGRAGEFARWVELVRAGREAGRAGEGAEGDWERGWKRFRGEVAARRRMRRLQRWMGAAAVVLLLVSGGVWWMEMGTGSGLGAVDGGMVVVMPGGTEAVLVMGDGRRVDLVGDGVQEVREEGVRVACGGEEGLRYDRGELEGTEAVYHRVEVPVGGEYHFTLEDGTRVWVNSASEVGFRLPFGPEMRELEVKGEVYVEVARDTSRPFIVHAGEVSVRALGTRFNVAAYGEGRGVVTTLTEGKVEVTRGEERVLLVPGEQAVAADEGGMVKQEVEARVFISWVNGVFEFENMSLAEIAERLGRWYGVSFRFGDEGLRERRYTGVFERNGSLNDILCVMGETTDVGFEVRGDEVRVEKR